MPTPTYWTETSADGTLVYHCVACKTQGQEHHSSDEALFLAHMEQRHDGRMEEDVEASAAAKGGKPDDTPGGRPETPPGQGGEQPGNRPDIPPGHDKPPPDEEPHPEHPIVEPDEEPHPEPHPSGA